MFTQKKPLSLKQHALKPAISRYLSFHERAPETLAHFAEGKGCCSGLTTVVLFGLFMSKQPKNKDQTYYDDWPRIKKTLRAILEWNPPTTADDKSSYIEPEFERLIGQIIYYQAIGDYLPVTQGEIQRSFFTTYPHPLRKEYTLAGLFTAEHLTRTVKVGKIETSILGVLLKEEHRMILISTGRHALGLLRHGNDIYLHNANSRRIKKYCLNDLSSLAKAIFTCGLYDSEVVPCQFGFRVFSFAKKPAIYPSQENILQALNPPITSSVLVNQKKPMALMIAIRVESIPSAKYYLEKGAPVDELNHNNHTPLYNAVKHNNHALIKLLLQHHATIHQQNSNQNSALQLAASSGNIAVVKILLEHTPHSHFGNLLTALSYLPNKKQREELLERIRKNKLKVMLQDGYDELLLHEAEKNYPSHLTTLLYKTYRSLFGTTKHHPNDCAPNLPTIRRS